MTTHTHTPTTTTKCDHTHTHFSCRSCSILLEGNSAVCEFSRRGRRREVGAHGPLQSKEPKQSNFRKHIYACTHTHAHMHAPISSVLLEGNSAICEFSRGGRRREADLSPQVWCSCGCYQQPEDCTQTQVSVPLTLKLCTQRRKCWLYSHLALSVPCPQMLYTGVIWKEFLWNWLVSEKSIFMVRSKLTGFLAWSRLWLSGSFKRIHV